VTEVVPAWADPVSLCATERGVKLERHPHMSQP
jgi:hypothetical protein